jgi:energy-coupling factor transporter transmembrane protein EcfT
MIWSAGTWFIFALLNLFLYWLSGFDEVKHSYILGFTFGLAFFFDNPWWLYLILMGFVVISKLLNKQDLNYVFVGLSIIGVYYLLAFFVFWLVSHAVYQIFKVKGYQFLPKEHIPFVCLLCVFMLF